MRYERLGKSFNGLMKAEVILGLLYNINIISCSIMIRCGEGMRRGGETGKRREERPGSRRMRSR
jgi:hypothetical protein